MEAASRVATDVPAGLRRPVLLATLGVPFDRDASAFAVDAAVEAGQPLIVVNVVELPPLTMSVNLGYDQLPDRPEDEEAFRAPAALARSTSRIPAGCISPRSMSAVALSRLIFDQRLRARRGVKRCSQ